MGSWVSGGDRCDYVGEIGGGWMGWDGEGRGIVVGVGNGDAWARVREWIESIKAIEAIMMNS